MKINAEEREAIKVATLATVTAVTSLARAVQKKRFLPAIIALGSACCAVGAMSFLDGSYLVAEATEVAESTDELLDETECEAAKVHLDATVQDDED